MTDTTKTISKHAMRFFSGTLVSRCSGGVRDLAMAFCFGAHPAIATFMVAFRFAYLFRRLFGETTASMIFAPHFEAERKDDAKKGALFFRDLFFSTSIALLILICLGEGVLALFPSELLSLTRLLLPSLFFICLYGLTSSLLHCERRFFLPAVAPVAFNLIWVVFVIALWWQKAPSPGVGLAWGVSIALFAQWLMTLPATVGYVRSHLTFKEFFTPRLFSKELNRIVAPFTYALIGVSAAQINTTLDSLFARFATLEGPAYLWYAARVHQIPLALFGIAIMSALLPALSRAFEAGDEEKMHTLLHFTLKRGFLLLFPCTIALVILAPTGLNLYLGRGAFTPSAIYNTTFCLWGYAIGLVPHCFAILIAPLYYAKKSYLIPMQASVASVIVNVMCNALFVFLFGWGAESIAVATSLSACVNLYFLLKHAPSIIDKKLLVQFAKVASGAMVSGGIVLYLGHLFWRDPTFALLFGRSLPALPRHFMQQITPFALTATLYLVLLWGIVKRFYIDEADSKSTHGGVRLSQDPRTPPSP